MDVEYYSKPTIVSLQGENLAHYFAQQITLLAGKHVKIRAALAGEFYSWAQRSITVRRLCIDEDTIADFSQKLSQYYLDPLLPKVVRNILLSRTHLGALLLLAEEDPRNRRAYRTLQQILWSSEHSLGKRCGDDSSAELLKISPSSDPLLIYLLLTSKADLELNESISFLALSCRQWLELYSAVNGFGPGQVFMLIQPCKIPYDARFRIIFQNNSLSFTNLHPRARSRILEEKSSEILLLENGEEVRRLKPPL
jgi:hypothetical protein